MRRLTRTSKKIRKSTTVGKALKRSAKTSTAVKKNDVTVPVKKADDTAPVKEADATAVVEKNDVIASVEKIEPPVEAAPPIVVENAGIDPKGLSQSIGTLVSSRNYKIILRGRCSIVYVKSKMDHTNVTWLFSKLKYQFFSYAFRHEKSNKYILKGLPYTFTVDDIKNELLQNKIQVISVRQFVKKRDANKNPIRLPVYSVTVNSMSTLDDIKRVSFIYNYPFTVERFESDIQPIQCRKCQAFGHGINYCYRDTKCLKCGGGHYAKFCTNTIIRCANCSGDHVTSYRQCERRLNYIKKMESRQRQREEQRAQQTSSTSADDLSKFHESIKKLTNSIDKIATSHYFSSASASSTSSSNTFYRPFRSYDEEFPPLKQKSISRVTRDPVTTSDCSSLAQHLGITGGHIKEAKHLLEELHKLNLPGIIKEVRDMINDLKNAKDPIERILVMASYQQLFTAY